MKNNYLVTGVFILFLMLSVTVGSRLLKFAIDKNPSSPPSTPSAQPLPITTPAQVLGVRTKSGNCQIQNSLPDPACTPGQTLANVTKEQICTPGYASSVRNVPGMEKDQVYVEYGLPPANHQPGEFEVDHLISLELGGSNDISNLWPEAADPRPGYHEKDRYENFAHQQVCSGKMSLEDAQRKISENWLRSWIEAGQP